ncbi:ABC transporter permease [Oceanobacillus sp. 1P07AA]|uniref:ABC transporter permease n=1 Tax=Oceanobacillus sp. 1P07AA TaxID=3132293 RepID=UPI0039A60503
MKLFRGSNILFPYLLRQHRLRLFLWIIGIVLVTLATASSYPSMYPNEQAREAFGLTMENPVMIAMLGVGYDNYEVLGSLFAIEMLLFTAMAVAIMNILFVSKATRNDEEEGRVELIRALSTGKLSYIHTTMSLMAISNILISIGVTCGLILINNDGMNIKGAILYGALLGATGLLFGSMTSVIAQIVETSRTTSIIAFLALLLFYLVRATGDVSVEGISYLSPLGWIVRSEVFVENSWWPVLVCLSISGLLLILAYYLQYIRDLGRGFIPDKKGKSHASFLLKTKLGFVFTLQRTMILTWLVSILFLIGAFAAILGDLEVFIADNEFIQSFLSAEGSLVEEFIILFMSIMAVILSIPVVMSILRLKGEENAHRIEPIISRSWSRNQVLATYALLSVLICIGFPIVMGLVFWLIGTNVMEEGFLSFSEIMGASMVHIPVILLVAGITIFLLGFMPKFTSFIWLFIVYGFIVVYFADILDLPGWVRNLSLYEHIPVYPREDIDMINIIIYSVVAVLLGIVGFIGYRNRDIQG